MNSAWTRRAALAAICSSAALLAACGSGSVAGAITPARFISVGDGFADVGQNGYRFTVNDGTNNWTQELASHYSLTLTAASSGGWSYAQGDARVDTVDTTSGTNAPSVKDQIDTLLARVTFADDDIVLVGGGIADIVNAVSTTGISSDTTATVSAAGTALGAQVRRLVTAGAQHVVIAGVYNLGISPWARNMGQGSAVESLTTALRRGLDDAELRARVGAAGRQRVVERWSWQHCAQLTVDQYREVLAMPHNIEKLRRNGRL